jgi:hypothetical protein
MSRKAIYNSRLFMALILACTLPIAPAWAAAEDIEDERACRVIDEADIIDIEVANMLDINAGNIGQVVASLTRLSEEEKRRVKRAIRYALVPYPGHVVDIVTDSLLDGATTEDIAIQCDCTLPKSIIPDLVGTAILNGASAYTMVLRCMKAVPPGEMYQVLDAALKNATPDQLEEALLGAHQSYNLMGIDGRESMIQVLVDGNYLTYEGIPENCTGDCLQPAASTLLDYVIAPDAGITPAGPGQAPLPLDPVTEPPLSDS